MSNTISTPSSADPQQAGETVEKRVVPARKRKLVNSLVKALLCSRGHRLLSGLLMLLTYQGRGSGKVYTNPIFYFEFDRDELLACTKGRWWVNVRDGKPVTLLVKGQELEAIPTVIRDREAAVNTLAGFIKRRGLKKAKLLLRSLSLPADREPSGEELRAKTQGRTYVTFKIVHHCSS